MGIEKMEAIVMLTFPFGDTSRIAHLFSVERGRVHVLAKGVRGPRGRFGAALEPFTRIGAVIYYKNGRDLQFLSQAEILGRRSVLGSSLLRFAYAGAVLELLDQALRVKAAGTTVALIEAPSRRSSGAGTGSARPHGYIASLLDVLGIGRSSCTVWVQRGEGEWTRGKGAKVSVLEDETLESRSGPGRPSARAPVRALCRHRPTLHAECRSGRTRRSIRVHLPPSLPRPSATIGPHARRFSSRTLAALYRGLRSPR